MRRHVVLPEPDGPRNELTSSNVEIDVLDSGRRAEALRDCLELY
jgi:hypothetical protein